MSDGTLRKCPACGKLKLRRLMGSGAGIIFRGSGFYETDYKRKSGTPSEKEGDSKPKESPTEKKKSDE
jgi:predicted nucleic acid-binding Zn ribbon protein